MKVIFRSFALLLLAGVTLWGMAHYDLIDFALIRSAFLNRGEMVVASFLLQTLGFILLMMRYVYIVRAFDVKPPLVDMVAATFVSVAVGQWAPGAIAVMEMLRIGLMFGASKGQSELAASKPRLVVASLYDRVIGFAVILFLGFVASLGLLGWMLVSDHGNVLGLAFLCLFSAVGTVGMTSLPFLAKWKLSSRAILWLDERLARNEKAGSLRMARRLLAQVESLRHILATGGSDFSRFALPAAISAVTFFLYAGATWCASIAIGTEIPLLAIFAVSPVIALAGLLPLGIGGMGGYQLISAAIFQIFAVDARVASGANLLQNAIALLASTLLGILFARSSFSQIQGILQTPRTQAHS